MPVTPEQIVQRVHTVSETNSHEDIVVFGDRDKSVNRVLVCWMATPEAILEAAKLEADMLICHESLFFPYEAEHTGSNPDFLTWPANVNRVRLLAQINLTCARFHYSADKLTIFDTIAQQLGLSDIVVDEPDFMRVYKVEPITYAQLLEQIESRGFNIQRRTLGDPGRVVTRIGLPWGGMGLSVNISYSQRLVEMGCEVLIGGEADSYTFHFAKESGVEFVETGHEASENPGLGAFCDWLRTQFPSLEVHHFENPPAYEAPGGC